ncbi:MAG TPA: response regulator transcription factor [Bacillota bacterium]|nr:response regulator transcription factor [Bacillota bacterium]
MQLIRVMIVEDDPVWRRGVADLISQEEDFKLVVEAGTKEEALALIQENEIDIVLMDINLTDNNLDGLDTAMAMLEQKEALKIIMLTSLTEDDVILDSFAAGAVNYVNKLHFREIPEAIRAAYANQSAIHASAAQALRKEFLRLKKDENQNLLTTSEKEILHLIHEGHTQTEIEQKLFIAKRTIKNHVNRILKKMGVSSSKEAAQLAKKKKMF